MRLVGVLEWSAYHLGSCLHWPLSLNLRPVVGMGGYLVLSMDLTVTGTPPRFLFPSPENGLWGSPVASGGGGAAPVTKKGIVQRDGRRESVRQGPTWMNRVRYGLCMDILVRYCCQTMHTEIPFSTRSRFPHHTDAITVAGCRVVGTAWCSTPAMQPRRPRRQAVCSVNQTRQCKMPEQRSVHPHWYTDPIGSQ